MVGSSVGRKSAAPSAAWIHSRRCASREYSIVGGSPTAGYFLLLAQEKSNQREGHPALPALRASLGFPKKSGGCGTRALRSDSPRRLPPISSEIRGGAEGVSRRRGHALARGSVFGLSGQSPDRVLKLPFPPPSSTAESGEVGEDCLRPAGPSSAAARLGEQRSGPVAKRRAAEWGRLFFGTFLLAKQKKDTSRRAAPGYQTNARSAQTLGFADSAQSTGSVCNLCP